MARNKAGADPLGRLADHDRDGIDVELIFPNKGLAMWATPDPQFAMAQCRVWNDWAWEQFGKHQDRMIPAGSHRHRRSRRLDRRGAAAGQARLQVPDAAVQADLGRP